MFVTRYKLPARASAREEIVGVVFIVVLFPIYKGGSAAIDSDYHFIQFLCVDSLPVNSNYAALPELSTISIHV